MIEACATPVHRAVAALARLRESVLHVRRIRGPLVLLQVAGDACLVGEVVVPVDVALAARRGSVSASQREPG